MLDPLTLFQYDPQIDQRTVHDRVMVITLGSYGDAGSAQAQFDEHLLNTLTHRTIGTFDADQVMDYRGHRPPIDFDRDHYDNYEPPVMTLHEITDKSGSPFLLLTGPEPALQWERVVAAIDRIIDELDVQLVVTAQSVPMPVPHTRPVGLLKVATRSDLLPGNQPSGSFRMSASFLGMMTQRLGESGRDVIGLVARVPQYLAEAEFPDAPIALVRGVNEVANLDVPLGDLEQASRLARGQIDAQVQQSEQLSQMVSALEKQYDTFMADHSLPMSEDQIPNADEIGQAVEDYLASLDTGNDGPNPAGPGPADRGPQTGPADFGNPDHPDQPEDPGEPKD
ncbi:Predicted ATP-dependent carboligase, ATP-grasp superfamily [Propionibacterium cyclohexanicum]|uniref:Predicted ATP-dependent carboligase, ATP-grasp superfamily n=1 Tax=Propionibacterium cyclohexanicum TaxID=64702 RepID=A0A1H9Q6G0_9ACTN|nr:PAC2 family protein [Propionibacterium cyclohexanicum]SER55499.1 Predicted ATP-dependent carboligase, ATP-grasp superfamily [Propionibacterium cyclohexanicum]